MGSAGGSLDDCEEQVEFWKIWNAANKHEKHGLGVMIGKKISELLKSGDISAGDVRQKLATYVRTEILRKRPARRRASRKSR
jgi:hypothetical protein